MYNLGRYYIICFLISLIVSSAEAQINPVYREMRQKGSTFSEKGSKKLTPEQYAAEWRTDLGYNDTTIVNLQKIGIDLLKLRETSGHWDEKVLAALSDCIVIGTVSKIEHLGGKSWFQTVAYVQVEEFLRNDYQLPKGQIQVRLVSGLTRTLIGEDTLATGERVLLFLSASSLIRFASDNNMHDLYNQLINDSTISFIIKAKYDLGPGKMFSRNRERNLVEVRDEIKTVRTTIYRKTSTDK